MEKEIWINGGEMTFLLFHFEGGVWYDTGPIFESEELAKKEINAYKKIMPLGFKDEDFVIVPNDGKAWKKYRPLDRGDRIYGVR